MSTDLRSVGFAEVRGRLTGLRLEVFDLLAQYGPCTGTELSKKTGRSVLSLRPRICDLRHMFHVVETGKRRDGEHEFRTTSAEEARMLHEAAQAEAAAADRAQPCFHNPKQIDLFVALS